MIKQSFILGLVVGVATAQGVGAQERVPCAISACGVLAPGVHTPSLTGCTPGEAFATAALRGTADSARSMTRTHWLEGGLIGAVVLGVSAAVFNAGLCESQHCLRSSIGYGALVGAAGFVAGALVGGQFRKGAKDTTSTR